MGFAGQFFILELQAQIVLGLRMFFHVSSAGQDIIKFFFLPGIEIQSGRTGFLIG
jgi:hypothetical protein